MLVLDGVYPRDEEAGLQFVSLPAPSAAELEALGGKFAERIGRGLERIGRITRDIENAYLTFDPSEEAPINSLLGHSITYCEDSDARTAPAVSPPRRAGGTVHLKARIMDDTLAFEVADNGVGAVAADCREKGLGLKAVEHQLKARFADAGRLEIITRPNAGFGQ